MFIFKASLTKPAIIGITTYYFNSRTISQVSLAHAFLGQPQLHLWHRCNFVLQMSEGVTKLSLDSFPLNIPLETF